MAFDFSTLPQVRSYSYMGKLGGGLGACSWYTPWDCSVTERDQAEQELQDAHNWLIDFANIMADLKQDAIVGGAPQSFVDGFEASLQKQRQLVQQHTAVMNAFYANAGGVAGLKGLGRSMGMGKLGWIIAATELATYLGVLARQLVWVWIVKIVGDAAIGFKTQAEAAKQEAITRFECYKLWREAKAAGTTPPNCSDHEPQDWTTIALIGGSVILAVLLLSKKR